MRKVTLREIAELAGVSLTSVHRVLNGKGGCSKAVEEKILRIAREQGYSTNITASHLRRQPLHIALVFPLRERGSWYFTERMLDGYLDFRSEVSDFNAIFQEFYLKTAAEKGEIGPDTVYEELETILRQIYREQPVHYDGLVIYGLTITRRAEALLNRIVGSGTKVVVLERSPQGLEDNCTVQVDDKIAGNMAGEMLIKGLSQSGTVVIISQLLPEGDPSSQICMDCLAKERPDLVTIDMPLLQNVDQSTVILQRLGQIPDLVGIYATSARHTHSMIGALRMLGRKPHSVIGSELFEDSYRALWDKIVDVIIDKRPEQIGYMGLQLLFNALVKNDPLPTVHRITPRVILRANSDAYYVKREDLYGDASY